MSNPVTGEGAATRIDVRSIMEIMPHRYPFLMVDRVLTLELGSHIEALKNVTINEPFFQGHFPGLPVMPGVLILEALAQAGGILVYKSFDLDMNGKLFMFSGLDKVRFRRPVVPGDQLILKLSDLRSKMQIYKMNAVATVDGEVAAEAVMTAALVNREDVA